MSQFRLYPKKILLVWCDIKGVVYAEFLSPNGNSNSDKYVKHLTNLKQAIRYQRLRNFEEGIIFQHDNARPYIAKSTILTIQDLG